MSNNKVITLNDLTDVSPTLVLRSTATALAAKRPPTDGAWTKTAEFFEQMFQPNRLKLEEKADKETTERNKQKVTDLFNKMKQHLDKQRDSILDTMDGMTSEQQEGIVTFWTEAYDFLIKVIEWMREIFNSVVEKIAQGFYLAKETVRGLFASLMDLIRKVF